MGSPSKPNRHIYELSLEPETPRREEVGTDSYASFAEPLLVGNILWFCRLRWAVAAVFAVFSLFALLSAERLEAFGLRIRSGWPFLVSMVLALANIAFIGHAKLFVRPGVTRHIKTNLWAQIGFDLAIVTIVVHLIGSTETFIPFIYLFHIVLACVFFSRLKSLAITGAACLLYALCVTVEAMGIVAPVSIYSDAPARLPPIRQLLSVLSASGVWLVVWHLTSELAAAVRQRGDELAQANAMLERVQAEKRAHMIRITHELKSPLAAIHANTHILLDGHCGPLSKDALEVINRILIRVQRLSDMISQMLQLARLKEFKSSPPSRSAVDIQSVLTWCIGQVKPVAEARNIEIETAICPSSTMADEEQLRLMFLNILSNAVNYSYDGGRVRVSCETGPSGPVVTVEDNGIGIEKEKLPYIFDDFYRTSEAVHHNKHSTGLGLAIVRQIARMYGIRIRVESALGAGTTFKLFLQPT